MRPGRRLFRAALRLLPSRIRTRLGAEMLAIYDARMAEASTRAARLTVWLSELGGVCTAAVRLREPGRHARSPGALDGWVRDARFGLRAMTRRPGTALLAVLTCALGIGSASAMFSVVDGVLLRPLPYPDPERVVSIYPTIEEWRDVPNLRANWDRARFSQPEVIEWSSRQTSFSQVAALSVWTRYLTGLGPATRLRVGQTTPGLFALADVRPRLGRVLRAEDGAAGASRAAVVSHGFWRSALGGASDVIGRTLTLNDVAWTVVGVLPEGFRITGHEADVWIPVPAVPDERERRNHNYRVIARLAPGVSLERAEQETALLLHGLSEQHETDITHGANVEPRLDDVTREVRGPLLVLLGGALLLLFAACANFAGLLLGAGLDRTTELAVRGALGAGRRRIVRLLLTESLLLALLGGAAGVLLALALTRGLVLLAPPGIPRIDEVGVDVRAVCVAFGLALLAGLVFGVFPALALGGADVAARLRARASTRQRHRLQASLVVAQVALATLLLVAGGLLARTLLHLDHVDPNFDPDPLLAVSVAAPTHRFFDDEGAFRRDAYTSYFDDIRTTLEGVPGVAAVASTAVVPFGGGRANNDIRPEGYEPAPGESLVAERHFVSGNYLGVIGARLVEGRLLTPADDRADAIPVTVVSRRLADRFWPDGSALGRRISFWAGDFTIVGVIEDMRDRTLETDDDLRFYVPERVAGQSGGDFVLRAGGDPARLVSDVRARLAAFDADLPVTRVTPLRELMSASLAERRYRARLLLCFAGLALFFAASGIHGAMSRRVSLRRHEIGVRMALGAMRGGVLVSVLREGVGLALSGILLGSVCALAASRLLAAWLAGVEPVDPITYAVIATLLVMTAALAAFAPSLRAARTDPMDSLRGD